MAPRASIAQTVAGIPQADSVTSTRARHVRPVNVVGAAYRWSFRGRTVYVVEVSHDGGMFIEFFDASGAEFASGGAGESTDFRWH